jgi:hypothetical protein
MQMPHLVHYDRATGTIRGVWTAVTLDLVLANIREDDATAGYLVCEDLDPRIVQEQYRVQDGALVLQTPPAP